MNARAELNLGLIGSSVSRSLSPFIHQAFFDCTGIAGRYRLFDIAESNLAAAIAAMRDGPEAMDGINVTIPHKVAVFDFLDSCTPQARAAGAVNTVVFKEKKLEGHNTDILGLKSSLEQTLAEKFAAGGPLDKFATDKLAINRVAIVGTGGASRAAVIALAEMGASHFQIFARTKVGATSFIASLEKSIELSQLVLPKLDCKPVALEVEDITASAIGQCQVLINATSIGHLNNDEPQWLAPMFTLLAKDVFVQDLVYSKNSEPTVFCRLAQEHQFENNDGKAMLVHQARFAFELFAGQLPPYEVGLKALLAASNRSF
ncbi:shikimate dehydrogenase [soil metagenome]